MNGAFGAFTFKSVFTQETSVMIPRKRDMASTHQFWSDSGCGMSKLFSQNYMKLLQKGSCRQVNIEPAAWGWGEPDRPALIAQPSARLGMNLRGRRKAKTSKGLQSWDTLGHCCGEFKASSRLLSRYVPTFPHSTQPTHVLCGGQRCGCHPLHVEQPLRGQNPFPKQLMFST